MAGGSEVSASWFAAWKAKLRLFPCKQELWVRNKTACGFGTPRCGSLWHHLGCWSVPGSKLVPCMDPAFPSERELKLPAALVLRLFVFSFFFHLCLLMLFQLWYRLDLRPTTPPLSTLFLQLFIFILVAKVFLLSLKVFPLSDKWIWGSEGNRGQKAILWISARLQSRMRESLVWGEKEDAELLYWAGGR